MCPLLDSRNRKQDKNLAQVGIYTAIPAILIVAPMIGYFIGSWADGKLGTEPYLLIVGLIFGFIAAAREIHSLIRKAQALENKKDKADDGT